MASSKLNNKTIGLRNFVELALAKVREGDIKEAELVLVDLWNDIGGAYVCVEKKPKYNCPVPKFNSKKDGNYSQFLANNNID